MSCHRGVRRLHDCTFETALYDSSQDPPVHRGRDCACRFIYWSLLRIQAAARESETPAARKSETLSGGILLIRHGEAQHNVDWSGSKDVLDTRLTPKGKQQASEALANTTDAYRALLADAELLVVSPLSRAVETASIIFGEQPTMPVLLTPLHSEHCNHACEQGSTKSDLRTRFPYITSWGGFDALSEDCVTNTIQQDRDWQTTRLPAFREWLSKRPEKRIAVVGHGGFFHALNNDGVDGHMKNCEIRKLDMDS